MTWFEGQMPGACILPAYLVGSGLKRWRLRKQRIMPHNSPGLFSREWIETPTDIWNTVSGTNSPGLFSREWIETPSAG